MRQCGLVAVMLFMHIAVGVGSTANAQIEASNKTGEVSFAGEHAGMKFEGVFERWNAILDLPPSTNPSITATFDLTTAKTGDSTYDSTLPEGDWFDVENHPQGNFKSTNIVASQDAYAVSGELTLRGKSLPIEFVLNRKGKELHASFDIDRLAYGIGLDSDPDADWVSQDINMTITIR